MGLYQLTHIDWVPKFLLEQGDVTNETCSPTGHSHLRKVLFSNIKETSSGKTPCSTDVPPGVRKVKLILPLGCQHGLTASSWTYKMNKSTPNHSQHNPLITVQHQSPAVLSQCSSACPWNMIQQKIKDFKGIRHQRMSVKPNSACYCYSCASPIFCRVGSRF